MFLSLNPLFVSDVSRLAFSTVQKWTEVLTAGPPDLASALHGFVVFTRDAISDVSASFPQYDVSLFPSSLVIWAPPISFIPPPPLPPPPPPDAVFTASDRFPSATYIPFADEGGVLEDLFSVHIVLLGMSLVVLLAVWTLQAYPSCKTEITVDEQVSREHTEDVQFAFAAWITALLSVLSSLKIAVRKSTAVILLAGSAGLCVLWASFQRVCVRSLNATGCLFFVSSKFAFHRGKIIGVKLARTIIPWGLEAVANSIIWLVMQGCRIVLRPRPPGPILQPEKTADNPAPRPRPQLQPAWMKWMEILLEGTAPTGLRPRDILTGHGIGQGGFGRVALGLNQATGQAVAIKRVSKRYLGAEGQYLIIDEIRTMNRLRLSVNKLPFPRLLGSFIDDSDYILVMEFIPGGTMFEKMDKMGGRLSRPLALFYAAQLLLAIHCLHKLGILHRDIKPDNILFDARGNLVLSDFGLAKVFDLNAKGGPKWIRAKAKGDDSFPLLWPDRDNPHLVDVPRGLPLYAAPEARTTERYSYGVDYWSFAMSFFEFLTGFLPYVTVGDTHEEFYVEPLVLNLAHSQVLLSAEEQDFFGRAFELNPYNRMSVREMKMHPVWHGLDWIALSKGALQVPRDRMPVANIVGGRVRVGRCA